MANEDGPYAGISEFELPRRMRGLAERIVQELIDSSRRLVADATRTHKDAAHSATLDLDRAQKAFEAALQSIDPMRSHPDVLRLAIKDLDTIRGATTDHMMKALNLRIAKLSELHPPPRKSGLRRRKSSDLLPNVDACKLDLAKLQSELTLIAGTSATIRRRILFFVLVVLVALVFSMIAGAVTMEMRDPNDRSTPTRFIPLGILLIAPAPLYWVISRIWQSVSIQRPLFNLLRRCQHLMAELDVEWRIVTNKIDAHDKDAETRLMVPAREQHTAAIGKANDALRASLAQTACAARVLGESLRENLRELWGDTSYAAMSWSDPQWSSWAPDPSPEFAGRIGMLVIDAEDLRESLPDVDFRFELPALIPFSEGRCLLLEAEGASKDTAARALQSVVIRTLANTPPGKARFTLLDPVGLGQNVADLMHLGDYNPQLINGKAWSESRHIDEQLTKLTEEMETVIQTYLRNQYATIHKYNRDNHEVAEPFRFLVVFDFPVNFSDSACRRLVSIVQNGPRCGVYTFILRDTCQSFPYGFDVGELRRSAMILSPANVAMPAASEATEDDSNVLNQLREAAEQGDADAQYNLAVMYEDGNGVAKDDKEATRWVRKAAEQGHADAQFRYGMKCTIDDGRMEAVEWCRKAAEQEHVEAQFHLGLWYSSGLGVAKDNAKAAEWFRKSAEQGDAGAQSRLGKMYEEGCGVDKDDEAAAEWYHKSAEQENVGRVYHVDWRNAQYRLGKMYEEGRGVARNYEKAAEWFCIAAKDGHTDAQYHLGRMYENGLGGARNDAEAIRWYYNAAQEENACAQWRLGVMYAEGRGVTKDDKEANRWVRKAAEQGHADAQYRLGMMMYADGSRQTAAEWILKAAHQGHTDAVKLLGD